MSRACPTTTARVLRRRVATLVRIPVCPARMTATAAKFQVRGSAKRVVLRRQIVASNAPRPMSFPVSKATSSIRAILGLMNALQRGKRVAEPVSRALLTASAGPTRALPIPIVGVCPWHSRARPMEATALFVPCRSTYALGPIRLESRRSACRVRLRRSTAGSIRMRLLAKRCSPPSTW